MTCREYVCTRVEVLKVVGFAETNWERCNLKNSQNKHWIGSIAQRRPEWWKRFRWSYERLLVHMFEKRIWCSAKPLQFFLGPLSLKPGESSGVSHPGCLHPVSSGAVCMGGDWPPSETNPGCSEWVGRRARTSCPGSWRPLRWCYSRCIVIISYMCSEMLMPLAHIQTTWHICTDVPLTYLCILYCFNNIGPIYWLHHQHWGKTYWVCVTWYCICSTI